MKINVIPAGQLSAECIAAWSNLQRSDPTLCNPFFRPEFTLAVAAERGGVDVAVLENDSEPVGFLPIERSRWRVGRAVGYYINQYQGAIVRGGVRWEPREVVRAAGLRSWRFDHLVSTQTAFVANQFAVADSPYLDLSEGFEHYRKSRGKSAAKFIAHIAQKDRKAGRELGDVRMEESQADGFALNRLLAWKIDQCRQRQVQCFLGIDWLVRLHQRLLERPSDDFGGMLFSLYIGGRPAAGFFCLRSGHVLQGSILGYDRELGGYAPGLILLMRLAQIANTLGVTRIDLGKGDAPYKVSFASACDQVTEGTVLSRESLAPFYRGWVRMRDRLRATPLVGPARRMRRWMLSVAPQVSHPD
jgi:CelD/BcsL family acetyltransferase involved in cellulose biosynthesis